ncbi:MAG: bifunctional hydroxymethylpyrimidine kinase/phosphomethylpyrimidine kinase, partial [Thauera sp.]|nr:bifunctional hydroxymethylpyrimidine kinase/phosphomethylpyrimidine kinase [Thauera sp.]
MSSSASPAASKGGASAASSGKSSRIPNVVSIAGVDPSGGAGVFADLKAFSALGAYGCGVIAALTAQNTQAVTGVHVPPTDFLRLQIDTLFADVAIHASKIGMLGSAEVTATVAERLAHWQAANVVLDPVMVAKSGDSLLAKSAISMMREALFPQAFLITPNLPEAGVLLEQRAPDTVKEMYRATERLRELLPLSSERWVLLKGGHLPGNDLVDLLFDGDRMVELPAQRIETKNTHGTGCTLSSAIAALLPQA